MAVEIEWKFVVERLAPLPAEARPVPILQGYLSEGSPVVRARLKGDRGFISIKAPHGDDADGPARRLEFEYPIPSDDARALIGLCDLRIEKTRWLVPGGIELDIFEGRHRGLVLAEIEVAEAGPRPDPPAGWSWRDVSTDPRYTNRQLAENGIPVDAPLHSEEELRRAILHGAAR